MFRKEKQKLDYCEIHAASIECGIEGDWRAKFHYS